MRCGIDSLKKFLYKTRNLNSNQKGMTLLEVLAAVTILSIFVAIFLQKMGGGIFALLSQEASYNKMDNGEQTALMLARQTVENLTYYTVPATDQTLPPDPNYPGYTTTIVVTMDLSKYTQDMITKFQADNLKLVEVKVSWNTLINGTSSQKTVELDASYLPNG